MRPERVWGAGAHRAVRASRGDSDPVSSRRASAWAAAQAFAVNRLILVVIGLLTSRLFYDALGRDHGVLGIWQRWDVRWYLDVADHGYMWHPFPVQSDLAFFPLYPLLIHLLTVVTPFSAYHAGLLISNLSFAGLLYLFHRLVLRDFGRDTADRAVYYLALFPTALFFFTAYSEALFLLCCLGCVYALRLRRWWVAGLCGMAAALTRQLGLLLIVPFAVEYVEWWEAGHGRAGLGRLHVVALGLIPAGTLAFMVYLQHLFGDGLLYLRAQTAWQRSLAPPWTGVLRALRFLTLPDRHLYLSMRTRVSLQTLTVLDLCSLVLVVVLIVAGAKRLPRSYTAYAVAVWFTVLINPVTGSGQPLALMSVSRFALTLFPPFIVLALAGRHRALDRLVQAAFVALLVLYTILFVRGRWVA